MTLNNAERIVRLYKDYDKAELTVNFTTWTREGKPRENKTKTYKLNDPQFIKDTVLWLRDARIADS